MNGLEQLTYSYADGSVDPALKYAGTGAPGQLGEGSVVDAVYSRSPIPSDRGNPFIEALPHRRTGDAFRDAYNAGIPGFSHAHITSLPREDQADLVDCIDSVKVMLPVAVEIETTFHSCIREGYRLRRVSVAQKPGQYHETVEEGEVRDSAVMSYGKQTGGEFPGMALIGFSGTGKTSTLEDLISDCPQVIRHHFPGLPLVTQIVFVLAQAESNDNLRGLLLNIAKGIDAALGNHNGYYHCLARRFKGIADISGFIVSLIEMFSIGVIVIDELQNCNFRKNKQASYEHLLTISNSTKCRFILAGTQDAVTFVTRSTQMSRRFRIINFSQVCRDRQYFAWMVGRFFRYQWFEPEVVLSDNAETAELIDALYDCSYGVIGVFKDLYKLMTRDYVQAREKPEINAEFVRQTAEKHSAALMDKYSDISDPLQASRRLFRNDSDAADNIEGAALSVLQASREITGGSMADEVDAMAVLQNRVISNIRVFSSDFGTTAVANTFRRVMKGRRSEECDEMEVTKEVFTLLKETAEKKRVKPMPKADRMQDADIDAALGLDQVG